MFNTLHFAMLSTIGVTCFGVLSSYSENITSYKKLKQYSDALRIEFSRDLIALLDADRTLATDLLDTFKRRAYPCWEAQNLFFRRLKSDLAAMKPVSSYAAQEWKVLAEEYNRQLASTMAEMRLDHRAL